MKFRSAGAWDQNSLLKLLQNGLFLQEQTRKINCLIFLPLFFAKGSCNISSMKIGYARVSTDEQNLDLQHRALKKAGCEIIYDDQGISGASFERQGLTEALNAIGENDILVVWKLDRLGRSLGDLIHIIDNLAVRAVRAVRGTQYFFLLCNASPGPRTS